MAGRGSRHPTGPSMLGRQSCHIAPAGRQVLCERWLTMCPHGADPSRVRSSQKVRPCRRPEPSRASPSSGRRAGPPPPRMARLAHVLSWPLTGTEASRPRANSSRGAYNAHWWLSTLTACRCSRPRAAVRYLCCDERKFLSGPRQAHLGPVAAAVFLGVRPIQYTVSRSRLTEFPARLRLSEKGRSPAAAAPVRARGPSNLATVRRASPCSSPIHEARTRSGCCGRT